MVALRLPERWHIFGSCPSCSRGTALTLAFAGGRLPDTGALALEAACDSCGHVWTLPPAEGASRAAQEPEGSAAEAM